MILSFNTDLQPQDERVFIVDALESTTRRVLCEVSHLFMSDLGIMNNLKQ